MNNDLQIQNKNSFQSKEKKSQISSSYNGSFQGNHNNHYSLSGNDQAGAIRSSSNKNKAPYPLKKIVLIQILVCILLVLSYNTISKSNQKYATQNMALKQNINKLYKTKSKQQCQSIIQTQNNTCLNNIQELKQNNAKMIKQYNALWESKQKDEYIMAKEKEIQQNAMKAVAKPFVQICQKKMNIENYNYKMVLYNQTKICQHQLQKYKKMETFHIGYFRWMFQPGFKLNLTDPPSDKQPYYPSRQQLQNLSPQKDLIIATPAGRKKYLQILYLHLLKQRQSFYKWHIWVCTQNEQDLQYIQSLKAKHDWIKLIRIQIPDTQMMLYIKFTHYFKKDLQKNKVYIKLDDDILWMDSNFIKTMWNHRFKLQNRLLIYPNTINNNIISHLNQRCGAFQYPFLLEYFFDGQGFFKPNIGISIHKQFLQSIKNNDIQKWKCFIEYQEKDYSRISINGLLYYSQTHKSLPFYDKYQDQIVYSMLYTRTFKAPSLIVGDAIIVHGAFTLQRTYFQVMFPQLVPSYKKIAQNL